jgi:hypothetical protein
MIEDMTADWGDREGERVPILLQKSVVVSPEP